MYGKLIDGKLVTAPKMLAVDDRVYYNPSDKLLEKMGYLPVEKTAMPAVDEMDKPKFYQNSYIEENGKIIEIWAEVEIVEEPTTVPEPTIEERVESLENNLSATMEAVDYLIIESGDTDA